MKKNRQSECRAATPGQGQVGAAETEGELAEAIARRVVELLSAEREPEVNPARLVDAASLARELGVERDWVYANAERLGAIRLGGPNGRLRFDREIVIDRLTASDAEGQSAPERRRPRRRPDGRGKRRPAGSRVRKAEVKSSQIQRRASVRAPARSPKQHQTGGSPE